MLEKTFSRNSESEQTILSSISPILPSQLLQNASIVGPSLQSASASQPVDYPVPPSHDILEQRHTTIELLYREYQIPPHRPSSQCFPATCAYTHETLPSSSPNFAVRPIKEQLTSFAGFSPSIHAITSALNVLAQEPTPLSTSSENLNDHHEEQQTLSSPLSATSV